MIVYTAIVRKNCRKWYRLKNESMADAFTFSLSIILPASPKTNLELVRFKDKFDIMLLKQSSLSYYKTILTSIEQKHNYSNCINMDLCDFLQNQIQFQKANHSFKISFDEWATQIIICIVIYE